MFYLKDIIFGYCYTGVVLNEAYLSVHVANAKPFRFLIIFKFDSNCPFLLKATKCFLFLMITLHKQSTIYQHFATKFTKVCNNWHNFIFVTVGNADLNLFQNVFFNAPSVKKFLSKCSVNKKENYSDVEQLPYKSRSTIQSSDIRISDRYPLSIRPYPLTNRELYALVSEISPLYDLRIVRV